MDFLKENWGALVAVAAFASMGLARIRAAFTYLRSVLIVEYTMNNSVYALTWSEIRRTSRQLGGFNRSLQSVDYTVSGRTVRVPFSMPKYPSLWYTPWGPILVFENRMFVFKFWDHMEELVRLSITRFNDSVHSVDRSRYQVHCIKGTAGTYSEEGERRGRALNRATSGRDSDEAPTSVQYEIDIEADRSLTMTADEINAMLNIDPLKGLYYQQDVLDLIADIQNWYDKRRWYEDHAIPWRMGVMTHGPGGTGKSSLSSVIAKTLKIPLYQFHLGTLTNVEMMEEWESLRTPCAVSFDDFDTVFHGRESVTEHKSLTFDTVLNCLSGISSRSGILVMLNTNLIEHIDEALGRLDEKGRPTRPGRISRILYMGPTDEGQRRGIATHVLDFKPELIEELVAKGVGMTANQFQQCCVDAATAHLETEGTP